jgi:hypothetical protein
MKYFSAFTFDNFCTTIATLLHPPGRRHVIIQKRESFTCGKKCAGQRGGYFGAAVDAYIFTTSSNEGRGRPSLGSLYARIHLASDHGGLERDERPDDNGPVSDMQRMRYVLHVT